ncbi:voltage-dependent T-type calcium channel subunit alpha-1G isoform X1 [Macrobrachium rosenbergii]|uniref:voltage-dependent T-type calcium channel subunit alpha-1G isoform X1 n=1 Tax=Macrobrachium rosenbergii TaxID=79674 RepID=UPI0034D77DA7
MENMNLSAIRTIRVLRPLRAINRIPSMRILVMLLLDTLPMLGNVLLLCFFVFFIFGIVGVQLWAGMLRQRCFMELPKNVTLPPSGLKPIYYELVKAKTPITTYFRVADQEKDYICSLPKDNGMHRCVNLPPTTYEGHLCNETAQPFTPNDPSNESCVNWNQYYTDCRPGDKNPFQGAISFDNIGLAWVAIFLVISLEGWTDIMYYVQDAHSFWDWIYFVLLIVIGSFFMINLCLVVIATQFSETKKREMERMKMERARFHSTSTLASGSTSEPNSCYAEIIKYIAHLWRRARRKLYSRYRQFRRRHRSDHPRQLSLKKQRRRRQYEAAQSALIGREGVGMTSTIVAIPSGGVSPAGDKTVMNNVSSVSPQLLSPHDPSENLEDPRNSSAPRASPEFSDVDPQTSPRRPVLLKIPSGASGDGSTSGNELVPMSPGGQAICTPRQRRRSSVMFSDVVLLHGHSGDTATRNVCHSEKTTQTDDEPLDPAYFREPLPPSPNTLGPPALLPAGLMSNTLMPPSKTKSSLRPVSRTPSYNGSGGKGSLTCGELLALSGALSAALPTHLGIDSRSVHTLYSSLAKGVKHFSAPTLFFSAEQAPAGLSGYYSASDSCNSDSEWSEDDWSEEDPKPPSAMKKACMQIRLYIKKLVEHQYFQRGILVAILVNTLSMGIEYHNQPETLTMIVEISNLIFSAVFAIEMLLKVIAEGPFGYISNGFNVFDGVIVVLSVVELYESYTTPVVGEQAGQGSGLSVLRTFRLLRILKLVRFMPQLRRQLFVMLRTLDNVAIFFSLLILFIFIFSVLGMFLFGGKFCIKADGGGDCTCREILDPRAGCQCKRMHFNSFLWATVTVFQILTQEDWNVVLFNGMEKTSHWASLYFVALMTFGNYVLFNLLVAILVEGFSAERNERLEKEQKELEKQKRKEEEESGVICANDNPSDAENPGDIRLEDKEEASSREVSELPKCTSSQSRGTFDLCKESSPEVLSPGTPVVLLSPGMPVVEGTEITEDEKKRSASTLDAPEDERRMLKGNEERIKENQLRQKLLYAEPKCNIEKESKLLQMPQIQAREIRLPESAIPPTPAGFTPIMATPHSHLGYPPIITHTAATPQGSPHATLESGGRGELNNRLTPAMALYCTAEQCDRPQGVLRSASIKSNNTSLSSRSSHTSSHVGPRITLRRESLSPHDLPGRRDSLSTSHGHRERRSSGCGSPLSWRRNNGSQRRRRGYSSNGSSFRRAQLDRENLVNHDSGSDADGEEETALNNNITLTNNNLNNHQATLLSTDHRLCNGSMSSHGQLGPRRSILTQQNSIGSPRTLSPQNSIRSRGSSPRSRQPSVHGQVRKTSVCGSIKDLEYKQNNLSRAKEAAAAAAEQEEAEAGSDAEAEVITKICFFFEPKGCWKERYDFSLYIFPTNHVVRRWCVYLVTRKWFDSTVLFFIGLNCITLAMERPNIPPDSSERQILMIFNYIFTFVFGAEMFIKVIAQGLLYGKGAYFSSGWNIMDGSLVVISFIDILMSFLATTSPRIFGILRVFRLLRALRPLRVINRAPGLKLVVQTLLSSLQPIGNIVVICCTFFIIFGILGVQLFKGSFYYCEGPDLTDIKTKNDCVTRYKEEAWLNRKYNFDDLGQALMSLFVLSSKDGWVNIMYTGLDAVGVDMQPKENYSQWRLLYFISFLLLVGFFVLNMFVGVVVENFHRCREEQEKEEKARRAAKRAKKLEKKRKKLQKFREERVASLIAAGIDPSTVDIEAEIRRRKRRKKELKQMQLSMQMREPPYYSQYSKARLFIHNIVTSKYFDLAIAAVIGLNVVTMAMEFYKMPKELEYALQIFNYFFTAVFILESAMKMVALGCRRYFQDSEEYRWNQLDVLIVILSVVGIVLEEMKSEIIPINPTIIRVMRVLRIARVLKLLKMAKGIRALLDTVMQALPQVGNLGLLFFLLFFIFAALGVELFGRLECDEEHPCQGLGEHAHFKNFGMAFLTLFRVATGDNWNGIMKDTLRDKCDSSPDCVKNCCLYPFVAPIFFVVFVLMAQFVLVNVVVAVLMKHLEESHKLEEEEAEFARLLRMEDEYDLEVEIERQLAQEEEEIAEMQENIANQKLAQQVAKDVNETAKAKFNSGKYFHKPLSKMSSLPSNFTFRGQRELLEASPKDNNTPPVSPGIPDVRVDASYTIPSININGYEVEDEMSSSNLPSYPHDEDTYNPNLKRPSPDEPEDKVSITDLRQVPPSITLEESSSTSYSPTTEPDSGRINEVPVKREAPLAEAYYDDDSNSDSISAGLESLEADEKHVPITQQAVRQSQWSSSRKISAGGGRKVSLDDSVTQSLMASFDNVPELGGRLDMDSTSCSVCSSEEVSATSRLSSGPSPLATSGSGPSTARDNTLVFSYMPHVPPPLSFADKDDDDTLASSSDSFTLEGGPPELPSPDISSGSEAMAALSATISPYSSSPSPSPVLSSPMSEASALPSSTSVSQARSSGNGSGSFSPQPSPTTLSAPICSPVSSSMSELSHQVNPFSSLGELRVDFNSPPHSAHVMEAHSRDNQPFQPKYNEQWHPWPERNQFWTLKTGASRLRSPHPESVVPRSMGQPATIGLQLGVSRSQPKGSALPAGQRCFIRGRKRSRPPGPES